MRNRIKNRGRVFTTSLTTTIESTIYNAKVEHLQELLKCKKQKLEDHNYAGS